MTGIHTRPKSGLERAVSWTTSKQLYLPDIHSPGKPSPHVLQATSFSPLYSQAEPARAHHEEMSPPSGTKGLPYVASGGEQGAYSVTKSKFGDQLENGQNY